MWTRRRGLALLLSSLLVVLAVVRGARAGDVDTGAHANLHVVILHTNDVHGQVSPRESRGVQRGGLPRLAAEVRRLRRELAATADGVLVLDAGDWFQGTPEGVLRGGAGYIEAMGTVAYDAAVLGNHEFDFGVAHLRELLETVSFPVVCANILDPDTNERVDWVEPHLVVEVAGARVGIVGLVSPDTGWLSHRDARQLVFEDPGEALARAKRELQGRVDWVLPLTHVGVGLDRKIAARHPDVPLIVGGHSHRFLPRGEREGETLIAQAGEKAAVLGRVDLWLDPTTKRPVRAEASLIELDQSPDVLDRDPAVEAICARLVEEAKREMEQVVGRILQPLERRFDLHSSAAGNWLCDAMRRRTEAQVALHNRGGLRSSVAAGEVRRRDLFELVPFPNHLVVMTLTGERLEACLRHSLSMGGKGLEFSGLVARVRPPQGERPAQLIGVVVNGEPLDPERTYRVVTNSFLASGGDGFVDLEAGTDRDEDPILLRELLELELSERGEFEPPSENRYEVAPEEEDER